LIKVFTRFFSDNQIKTGARFLVGVSGGIDSVVLADLCKKAGLDFAIAHCNFHLREEESVRDEHFVRQLASHYEVDVFVENFDTIGYASNMKLSVQQAARDLRYDFFSKICRESGFDYTLLAHHADDNVETIMMNFFRGTGIKGLKGIPSIIKKETIFLRPVLKARRSDIVEYAQQNALAWAEDSSNESIKYTRNYFRHQVIPLVKTVFPAVEDNLVQNAERFARIDAFYSTAINKTKKDLSELHEGFVRMPVSKLKALSHTSVIYEIISGYGFGESQVNEFIKLLEAGSGKFIESDTFQLIRHNKWIIFAEKKITSSLQTITDQDEVVEFANGFIVLQKLGIAEMRMDASPDVALVDARHVEYPLVLRKWKEGDYFYPLGMSKKKKVARFLIDLKIPKNRKEDVWVVESNRKILWVAGLRLDHRVRIQESTRQVLKITFKRKNGSH
jgi:tRNA(Ile)-lysidine synthase